MAFIPMLLSTVSTFMLDNLLERIQPTHVLVAFDAKQKQLSVLEMFADYKAGRAKTPEEFREQFPYIRVDVGCTWYRLL